MKLKKMNFIACLLIAFIFVLPKYFSLVEATQTSKEETVVEIHLTETTESMDKTDDQDTIYTPNEPSPVRVLPNTGELITSFIYMIVGLSFLLFIFGLLVIRMIQEDIRWDY